MSDSKKVPSSTDYRKWDTYDADSECLKLDIEEERESELKLRKEGVDLTRKEEGAGDAKFTSHLNSEPRLSLEEKEIIDISPSAGTSTNGCQLAVTRRNNCVVYFSSFIKS